MNRREMLIAAVLSPVAAMVAKSDSVNGLDIAVDQDQSNLSCYRDGTFHIIDEYVSLPCELFVSDGKRWHRIEGTNHWTI